MLFLPPYYTMSVATARSLICPPRVLSTSRFSIPVIRLQVCVVSSVRAGPHYSLASFAATRLLSFVPHSPSPSTSCHAASSSLISLVHKAPVDVWCYPLSTCFSQSLPSHVSEDWIPSWVEAKYRTKKKKKSSMWDKISQTEPKTRTCTSLTHTSWLYMSVVDWMRFDKSDYDIRNCSYWKHLNHILSLYENEWKSKQREKKKINFLLLMKTHCSCERSATWAYFW